MSKPNPPPGMRMPAKSASPASPQQKRPDGEADLSALRRRNAERLKRLVQRYEVVTVNDTGQLKLVNSSKAASPDIFRGQRGQAPVADMLDLEAFLQVASDLSEMRSMLSKSLKSLKQRPLVNPLSLLGEGDGN